MVTLYTCVVVYITTLLLTRSFILYASKTNLIDNPNERSSHLVPKPRGGGIVFVLSTIAASLLFFYKFGGKSSISEYQMMALVFGGIVIAVLGYIDDRRGLSQVFRLVVHTITMICAISIIGLPIETTSGLYWIFFSLITVSAVWILNLYNFMDGIDGVAASEGVFIFFSVAVLSYLYVYDIQFISIMVSVGTALLAFLRYNWPPSRLFMGDTGSGFIGYVIAVMVVISWENQLISPVVWMILLGFFVVDTTMTLLGRLLNGRAIFRAHKEHIYQKLSVRWESHSRVTLFLILVNVLWLLPLAWVAVVNPEYEILLISIAYVPIITLYFAMLSREK